MTETIWKYPIDFGRQLIGMPIGAKPLCFQAQNGKLTMWARVSPHREQAPRAFQVIGTGHALTVPGAEYIGTCQLPDGTVWHLFEV
jgi:hypothetical protein